MNIVDLTHTFSDTMPVYPGDPIPELRCVAEVAVGGITKYEVSTGMHVGTHMDAPLHMVEGGAYLSEFPPDKFLGRGVLLDARGKSSIDTDLVRGSDLRPGDIAIIMTGLSKRYRSPEYFDSYPEITSKLAQLFVEAGVSIVGMDTPSPDRPPFGIHKILLGNRILIIENLTNLHSLEGRGAFELIALPAKFHAEAAPTRVIARFV